MKGWNPIRKDTEAAMKKDVACSPPWKFFLITLGSATFTIGSSVAPEYVPALFNQ